MLSWSLSITLKPTLTSVVYHFLVIHLLFVLKYKNKVQTLLTT